MSDSWDGGTPSRADETASHAPDPARRRLESEFLLMVRKAGSVMQLLGATAADRLGINVTDLNCLNILALNGQLTAGELARATGLTTASITGVLDRLETAGFVHRERDQADRRRVVVRLDAARGMRDVGPVFEPVVQAWREAAAEYTDEQLSMILEFQHRMEQIMRDGLAQLRSTA
jgi:DNA-binding transcriptional regulator GbsR (MarR family)